MLDGQEIAHLHKAEPDSLHLAGDLFDGHFVERFDRHLRIFAPVFEKDDPPTGGQTFHDGLHHFPRMGELVIRIDHDHDIDLSLGQTGILHRAQERLDVRDLLQLFASFDEVQHLLLDIDREHFSLRHERSEEETEIARPGPDIGDHIVGFELEILDHEGGLFLPFAVAPLEPRDGVRADRLGDFTSHVDLAGAVA